jgi:hypothetical protein
MRISFKEIQDAYDFVSFGEPSEQQAFLCKESGQIYWHSEDCDEFDELPDDIDDADKYIAIPHKLELGLGKRLVFAFASQFLPRDIDEIDRIFSKKGAYARFKALLARRGALDNWYDFEAKAEEKELREWCELNSIELID